MFLLDKLPCNLDAQAALLYSRAEHAADPRFEADANFLSKDQIEATTFADRVAV
jgi:hypothetical protein